MVKNLRMAKWVKKWSRLYKTKYIKCYYFIINFIIQPYLLTFLCSLQGVFFYRSNRYLCSKSIISEIKVDFYLWVTVIGFYFINSSGSKDWIRSIGAWVGLIGAKMYWTYSGIGKKLLKLIRVRQKSIGDNHGYSLKLVMVKQKLIEVIQCQIKKCWI